MASTLLPLHPYYPLDLELTNYAAPGHSPASICVSMGAYCLASLSVGWLLTTSKAHSRIQRCKASWYSLCASLHLIFEGYYVLYRQTLVSRTDVFAEAWKEYALSDARYLTNDPFVSAIETLTVLFLGPIALATCISTVQRHSSRHALEIMTCLMHLYGCMLYFATSAMEGHKYCRPEFRYAWVYFFGLNSAWIIVPAIFGYQAFVSLLHR